MYTTHLPWIKLYVEPLDDPKLFNLSERRKWRFVQLLLLAGLLDAEGYLSTSGLPLSDEYLAWRLRCDLPGLQADLQALAQARLIEFDAAQAAWLIPSFAARQSRPENAQRLRWREQKRSQRLSRLPKMQSQAEPADLSLDEPDPAGGERVAGQLSDLAASLSADRSLDRPRNVRLKRRVD
jgi:hypothetical protein